MCYLKAMAANLLNELQRLIARHAKPDGKPRDVLSECLDVLVRTDRAYVGNTLGIRRPDVDERQ
jgi:hypothetical protein